jgi:hypothetical protein
LVRREARRRGGDGGPGGKSLRYPAGKTCPAKAGHQPEPSLASHGATRGVKRRQGGVRAVLLSPEIVWSWEPTPSEERKAAPGRRKGLAPRSRRGPRTGHARPWVPQEPERPRRLCLEATGRGTGHQNPGLFRAASRRGERAKTGTRGQYRRATGTERGGTGGEGSERRVVPEKRGNLSQGTPWREGGAWSWNRRGARHPGHCARGVSRRDLYG